MTWPTGEQYSAFGDHLLAVVAQAGSRMPALTLGQRLIGIVCATTISMLLATAPVVLGAKASLPPTVT